MGMSKRNYGAETTNVEQFLHALDCDVSSANKMPTNTSWTGERVQPKTDRISMAPMPSGYSFVWSAKLAEHYANMVGADNIYKICSWNVYKFLNNPNPADRISNDLKPYITKPAAQVTLQDIINAEKQWAMAKRSSYVKTYAQSLGKKVIDEYESTYLDALKAGLSAEQASTNALASANQTYEENKETDYTNTLDDSISSQNSETMSQVVNVAIGITALAIGAFATSKVLGRLRG